MPTKITLKFTLKVALLGLLAGLALVPVSSPATAAPAAAPSGVERTATNCQQASKDLTTKQEKRKKLKKKRNVKRKQFRKAVRADRKIDSAKTHRAKKKAKKQAIKARKKFRKAKNAVRVAKGVKVAICTQTAPPVDTPDPTTTQQLQQLLLLLQKLAANEQISVEELRAILAQLLPGNDLDPAVLQQIIDALQSLDQAQLERLIELIESFGPGLTPEQLQALLDAFLAEARNGGTGGVLGAVEHLIAGLTGSLESVGLKTVGDAVGALLIGTQGSDSDLTPGGLNELLETLLPGALDGLSLDQLADLLTGANGTPDLALLDKVLTTLDGADLTAILSGDQAALQKLLGGLLPLVAALTGQDLPDGALDPGALQGLVSQVVDLLDGLVSQLGLDQVGDLLQLLLTGLAEGDLDQLDLADLTSVLNELLPGITDVLSNSQLQDLLDAVNSGGLDAGALEGLLGGLLSAADIQSIIDGVAGEGQLTELLGEVLSQLAGLGGGGIELPLTSELGGILGDVVGLLEGILGRLLCGLLIAC